MNYAIRYSGRFKKSYKLCKRRGLDMSHFEQVIRLHKMLMLGHLQTSLHGSLLIAFFILVLVQLSFPKISANFLSISSPRRPRAMMFPSGSKRSE